MESGGSGPEKNDPPGRRNHCDTQLLYSDAALFNREGTHYNLFGRNDELRLYLIRLISFNGVFNSLIIN